MRMPYIPPMPDELLVIRIYDRCMRAWLIPWWTCMLPIKHAWQRWRYRNEDFSCNCSFDDDDEYLCWDCSHIGPLDDMEPVYTWLKLCHKWDLETHWRCREGCRDEHDQFPLAGEED